MNGVEKIVSVISCGIMDLPYDGFGCQNMNIVHFHEYVQEIKDGFIEIFLGPRGPLVLPLMQTWFYIIHTYKGVSNIRY